MDNKTDWQTLKKTLSERFRELFILNEWTDCAFSVGDTNPERIKCHKLVLAASSPVFEALFYGPLADYDEVVCVPDLEPQTFKLLLRYIYCDAVELNSILDAGMLLYASKKYLLPHLSRICLDYIIQHMQISNLSEVLDVAESLNEEELLDSCLKVMRRYSTNIWSSSSEHLSKMMVSRLLDQDPSNIPETELWTFVISWAKMECRINSIKQTAENIRVIIDDLGLLKKIRFLTFTKQDLHELVEPSGVISVSELAALKKCIESINDKCCDNTCDKCSNKNIISDSINSISTNNINNNNNNINNNKNNTLAVPDGFNDNCKKRLCVFAFSNHCSRKMLTKQKTWIYGGTVCTKVTSLAHVLVTGFEVFTRIPSSADYCLSPCSITGHYNERLTVKISDDKGVELGQTFYTGVAEFNASQIVKLSQPIWFYPHRKYTVTFVLSDGQYPLSQLSGTSSKMASCKVAVFRFQDFTNYPEGYPEYFPDFSFISAVMFLL